MFKFNVAIRVPIALGLQLTVIFWAGVPLIIFKGKPFTLKSLAFAPPKLLKLTLKVAVPVLVMLIVWLAPVVVETLPKLKPTSGKGG